MDLPEYMRAMALTKPGVPPVYKKQNLPEHSSPQVMIKLMACGAFSRQPDAERWR